MTAKQARTATVQEIAEALRFYANHLQDHRGEARSKPAALSLARRLRLSADLADLWMQSQGQHGGRT
jgi:hypothetical protein